jgi:hypothetical protein
MKLRICMSCLENVAEPGRTRCTECTPGAAQRSRKPPPREPDPKVIDVENFLIIDPDRLAAHYLSD